MDFYDLPGLADTQSTGGLLLGHQYQEALGDEDKVL